jgi:hypothetical protein
VGFVGGRLGNLQEVGSLEKIIAETGENYGLGDRIGSGDENV